ncbi:hypothetical protein ACIGW7_06985 [Streptomyces sp. NPDC053253]|uniref:hypothetical protein n=1 Tax=Streptomyces sp. NPDC053253 TaxID=3365699 RepID=UPI0037D09D5A
MPLEAAAPRQIGAFRLLGVLGSGGMGRVCLGAVPGKFAAVKRVLPVLAEDTDFLSHLGHELDNLARLPAGAHTKRMGIGTPAYMAPEQAVVDGQLTGAADVFAPGSLALYAANGVGDGSGPDLLYRVVHGEPDFGQLTDADPELTALLRRCFAKDPADRPPPQVSSSEPRSAPPGPSGPPLSANA